MSGDTIEGVSSMSTEVRGRVVSADGDTRCLNDVGIGDLPLQLRREFCDTMQDDASSPTRFRRKSRILCDCFARMGIAMNGGNLSAAANLLQSLNLV